MSKKKPSNEEPPKRRYRKSNNWEGCMSPTTSQDSEDAAYDDCEVSPGDIQRWTEDNLANVKRSSDSESCVTLTSSVSSSKMTPTVSSERQLVASANPSLSTISSTSSSLGGFRTEYQKRKLREMRRVQEAIVDEILQKRKNEDRRLAEKLQKEMDQNTMMTQHFSPRNRHMCLSLRFFWN